MTQPLLLWLRQDLRLSDHPALLAAIEAKCPIIPVFILDTTAGVRPWGGASLWWLHHSLKQLAADFAARGATLILRKGPAAQILDELIAETRASGVYWSRCYEPYAIARDSALKASLQARGLGAESFNASLLFEPWQIKTKTGGPYQVFTPFWKTCLAADPPTPAEAAPDRIEGYTGPLKSLPLDDLLPLPTTPDWAHGLRDEWQPGEAGAQQRLQVFMDEAISSYKDGRNFPAQARTSRLSPHLHWGEISVRQIWHAASALAFSYPEDATHFLSELGWREFSHHLLYHFPHMPTEPLNPKFKAFPWQSDEEALQRWQKGQTGIPIVDAGLRELWHTGWMHNRVRMIVGSYLVKNLLIPWQEGEAWFWDTLVDANLANNCCGWQWIAGCGADAAPYFRIFNPMLQGTRFDGDGAYVRRWCPELAALPDKYIHAPWDAPPVVLTEANLRLGETYPLPMVEHNAARDRALAAYSEIKGA